MKPTSESRDRECEGVFIALLPKRGAALVELLRESGATCVGAEDAAAWTVAYGALRSPAGTVAFRLNGPGERFPWHEGLHLELAREVSRLGPGRCWVLALEKPSRSSGPGRWAEAAVFDQGEQAHHFEVSGPEARNELLAWAGEELALSENEVLAVFESCDQLVGLLEGQEPGQEDEVDQALARARREFQRYLELKG